MGTFGKHRLSRPSLARPSCAPRRYARCVTANASSNASSNASIMTSLRKTTSYLVSTQQEERVGELLSTRPWATSADSSPPHRSVLVLGRSMG